METLKNLLAFPMRAAGALIKIGGRITIGATGFVMMGGALLVIDFLHLWVAGIPLFLIGLLLLVKAIF
jgi:hypothetical protein